MSVQSEPSADGRTTPLTNPTVQRALASLREGYEFAEDLHKSAWDFATDISALLACGCTMLALQWLVTAGYAEYRLPSTRVPPVGQTRRGSSRLFPRGTRFVATELGVWAAREAAPVGVDPGPADSGRGHPNYRSKGAGGELWHRGQRVLTFRKSASYMRKVIEAFEHSGWQPQIPDPLPLTAERGGRRRARRHSVVKNLNYLVKQHGLYFFVSESGDDIAWKNLTSTEPD